MKKNHRHTLFASICFILLSGTILFGCGQASTQTSLKQESRNWSNFFCFEELCALDCPQPAKLTPQIRIRSRKNKWVNSALDNGLR